MPREAPRGWTSLKRRSSHGRSSQARLFAAPDASSILHRQQWEIVEHLKASGVPYTLVRPQAFMQNLFMDAPTIQSQDVIYNVMGGARLAMIDRRDDAAVIATTLTEDGHEGRDYTVSGPALVNYRSSPASCRKRSAGPSPASTSR